MARDSTPASPDASAIFRRSALALAETFRALARERGTRDPDATRDLTTAADAIDQALQHIT
jgi:hypothetical protein